MLRVGAATACAGAATACVGAATACAGAATACAGAATVRAGSLTSLTTAVLHWSQNESPSCSFAPQFIQYIGLVFGLFLKLTLNEFCTHSGVVVRTFPEACLVIDGVEGAVLATTPVPLAILAVDELVLDELPAMECLFKG